MRSLAAGASRYGRMAASRLWPSLVRRRPIVVLLTSLFAAICAPGPAGAGDVSGAGATFPYPVYAEWTRAYKAQTGVNVLYQAIGSSRGIARVVARTVDFGASDMPLDPQSLTQDRLLQWPMVMGGVVPIVNLPGIEPGQLKLDGKVLAGMYLGAITKWNDPAIAALNPGLALPGLAITTVHRADGSGTNFIFTHYLSGIDAHFRSEIGENTAVQFPGGVGADGNVGVAALTRRTAGAIGYVEYAYALQNRMTYVLLRNRAGAFVAPTNASFQAAAANADWSRSAGFQVLLTDQPGRESWPITGATFILVPRRPANPVTARQALDFFDWAYRNGGKLAERLAYVPMPAKVIDLVERAWHREITGPDGKPVWAGS